MRQYYYYSLSTTSTFPIISAVGSWGCGWGWGLAFSIESNVRWRQSYRHISNHVSTSLESVAAGAHVVEWTSNESDEDNNARFSAQTFAASKCWGRRPFLLRGAFDPDLLLGCDANSQEEGDGDEPVFVWPSWGEVVEIAADDESESRVISHIPGDHSSFDLQWGPLNAKDTNAWISKPSSSATNENNRRKESLVVNDIDRFYPPLADWMYDTFRFLPNWRMDDGQISLSEKGGGIGPHVDNYDVFLIQMSGTRTWQVGKRIINAQEERDRTIDGLDVRVLDNWNLDLDGTDEEQQEMEEWVVHPGDLLYLPPRVTHCGTSLSSDCMTLSVGCRSPSVSDLVSKLAENLSSSIEDSAVRRYTDSDLLSEDSAVVAEDIIMPGELTSDAKDRAKHLVIDSLTSLMDKDEWWDEFFGRYVTEQKRVRNNYPIPLEDWADEADDEDIPHEWSDAQSIVQSVLAGEGVLYHAEGIAFAYSSINSKDTDGRISHRFFVNGEMWQSKSRSPADANEQNCIARMFKIVPNHRRLDRALLLGTTNSENDEATIDGLATEEVAFLEELVSAGVLYVAEE